jgi:hypothetical protein
MYGDGFFIGGGEAFAEKKVKNGRVRSYLDRSYRPTGRRQYERGRIHPDRCFRLNKKPPLTPAFSLKMSFFLSKG